MSTDLDRAVARAIPHLVDQEAFRKSERLRRMRERYHERYHNDPEFRERVKAQTRHRDRAAQQRRGTAERLFRSSKKRAKRDGVPFDLTVGYLRQLWPTTGECPVLGFRMTLDGDRWQLPSIDRIDSDRGYVQGNVRIISYRANMLKSNSYKEEFARVLAYLMSRDPLHFAFKDGDHLVEYVKGFEPAGVE